MPFRRAAAILAYGARTKPHSKTTPLTLDIQTV
jgi:hypothetical protein